MKKNNKLLIELIVDEHNSIIIGLSSDYKIIIFNKLAEEIFSIPKKLIINLPIIPTLFSNDVLSPEADFPVEIMSPKPVNIILADKKYHDIIWTCTKYYTKKNTYFVITGIRHNIVNIEPKLTGRERELKNIIENLPEYIFWKDKNLIYRGCNKNVAEYLGLSSPEDIIGKTDYDFNWSDSRIKELQEVDSKVLENKESINVEDIIPDADGSPKIMLTCKSPRFDNNGNSVGILGVTVDITAQREAQKLREAKAILEKQLESATLLGASIAHELRTPLIGMGSYATIFEELLESLKRDYIISKSNLKPSVDINEEYLNMGIRGAKQIAEETKKSHEFINMLLMNITSQNISDTSFQIYTIEECIAEALARYPFKEFQKRIIHYNCTNNFEFKGSQQLIVHVLFNLLKNALFYIADAGKGEIYITTDVQNDQHHLIFKDTGKGIQSEHIPYIFERFRSYRDDGAGIGLTFCKRVMEAHGGDIICRSEFGEFTEFILNFPSLES